MGAPQKPQPWTDFRATFFPLASRRELQEVVEVAMRHGGLRCDRGAKAEAPRARTTRKDENQKKKRSSLMRERERDSGRRRKGFPAPRPPVFLAMDSKTLPVLAAKTRLDPAKTPAHRVLPTRTSSRWPLCFLLFLVVFNIESSIV